MLWKLKSTLSLLSLNEEVFLLEFSYMEDYEMVWMGSPWFLFGKLFILKKKGTFNFQPIKEVFSSNSLWIKILDVLPLCVWNPNKLSRMAIKIGIPLAVDSLTTNKARLTYARVCIEVDKNRQRSNEIHINFKVKDISLKVQYVWKCIICSSNQSLVHTTL